MRIEFAGEPIPGDQQDAILEFAGRLADHPHGGAVEGRIVQARPMPTGITATMEPALREYMEPEAFERWRVAQAGRIGVTGGKTFVGEDEVVTAVVCPMPTMPQDFLDLAAHELIEMSELNRQRLDGWMPPEDPDEADGIVLFDEYRNERVREEIGLGLNWPAGRIHSTPTLVATGNELADRMPPERFDPPPLEYFSHWMLLCRSWAMALGRADAGRESAQLDIEQWKGHRFGVDNGFAPVASAMFALYQQPKLDREELARQAAGEVRGRLLDYGRHAWRLGP